MRVSGFRSVGSTQGRGGTASDGSRCQKGRGEVGSGKSEEKPVHCGWLRNQDQFVSLVGSLPARGQTVNVMEQ